MAVSVNKWLLIVVFILSFNSVNKPAHACPGNGMQVPHPFHVSVTEINHNAKDKTLEISCKIFTDDLEEGLSRLSTVKIDLINPKDKPALDKSINDYIHDHLQIKTDGKAAVLNYLGYEVENEAVYIYLQADAINQPKKIEIVNSIMYDLFDNQIGINHVVVGGNRKSVRLDYPNKQASLQF